MVVAGNLWSLPLGPRIQHGDKSQWEGHRCGRSGEGRADFRGRLLAFPVPRITPSQTSARSCRKPRSSRTQTNPVAPGPDLGEKTPIPVPWLRGHTEACGIPARGDAAGLARSRRHLTSSPWAAPTGDTLCHAPSSSPGPLHSSALGPFAKAAEQGWSS